MMTSHTTLEQKFAELQRVETTPQNHQPKIQRVAEHIRNREKFKEHYSPRLMSIGPIHHDNTNLKLGEKYKLMWAAKYIEDTRRRPQDLHKQIADNIDELKGLYAEDVLTLTEESLNGFCSLDEKLSWILFVDGCSLLHILENADFNTPWPMNMKADQLSIVMMDVLLLENQLPYLVLKLLWKNENEIELINTMKNFHKRCDQWPAPENKRIWRPRIQKILSVQKNKRKKEGEEEDSVGILIPNECEVPTHLLDLQRTIVLTKSSSKKNSSSYESIKIMTYRNIQDLRAVGIKLKSSATRRPTDIDFSDGWFAAQLTLPEIVVDETTTATFLNLIAYEMCPDFENDYGVCSFVAFMDSLIDHPEDVRELRSKRILHHCLCSDEEVANLFNLISKDLVDNTEIYLDVRDKIHKHCCNKYKIWIALGINTYFNNPWAFVAFLAAFIALTLTFVQTWFAMYPANK